jgi:hypothetical protein
MVLSAKVLAARHEMMRKRKLRKSRAAAEATSRIRALPAIPRIILDINYVNPVTLNFPKNKVVYQLKNRFTGRTNYYDRDTFRKLITAFKNDYNLLMMNPKEPIPGARNPMTRNPIYPRNVRRVTVAAKKKTPSPNTAAKKIQSAARKMLSKKRANAAKSRNAKPKTPSPNKRKTPSPNKKSTSKSRSK